MTKALRQDLPVALERRLMDLIADSWEAVVSGDLSPAEAEEKVVQLGRQIGQELLSAGFSERFGKHEGCTRQCPRGKVQRVRRAQR